MLLEEFLKPLGLSQTELAERIGVSFPRVNELIHGKRGMTPDTALRLERLLGVEAEFWLNLQLTWDLYHAHHSKLTKELKRIRRLPALRSREPTAAAVRNAIDLGLADAEAGRLVHHETAMARVRERIPHTS